MFNDERSWLNRVWTMQETTSNWLLGGLVPEEFMVRKEDLDLPTQFHDGVCSLLQVLARDPPDLFALAKVLRSRRGTHHIDQVSALGLLLKCPALPIYDTKQRCEDGWGQLVQQMSHKHRTDLLVNCPVVGNAPGTKWCPSWSQLMLGKTIPSETTVINYSEGELLNCSPISHDPSVNLGVVYWNYAYVIESCEFSIEDGRIHMHVLLGPASQSQFATDSYKTQPFLVEFSGANPLFDPDFYYAAAGMANLEYWVLGKISGHGRNMGYVQFEKRSTFRIPCARERERLWHLNPSYSDTPIRYL
ncbi:uncharacterized protein PHACADRAFT_127443 [Phanerochaete carnosa HHB-10118-sp]|uniref:Heterokaryon incompatibility domain-containing protein n=1 Tax=Phanerochaete carnosa (strain HHB-10118-sp) TaxID=650164 RepID=K5VJX3_PHACS|nr:uncharacterized protein PHACADRAFT_127443 [Phanerochaete carnosa HHB-10118-sp]EKM51668.1 hypothetical protein PHACADRAFT_127443 [Phanerochaete carnosa HHB-10118-sp]